MSNVNISQNLYLKKEIIPEKQKKHHYNRVNQPQFFVLMLRKEQKYQKYDNTRIYKTTPQR